MPVEEQVLSIYLATSVLIEKLDLSKVKAFEMALLAKVRSEDQSLLEEIRSAKKFTPDSETKLRSHIQALLDGAFKG